MRLVQPPNDHLSDWLIEEEPAGESFTRDGVSLQGFAKDGQAHLLVRVSLLTLIVAQYFGTSARLCFDACAGWLVSVRCAPRHRDCASAAGADLDTAVSILFVCS